MTLNQIMVELKREKPRAETPLRPRDARRRALLAGVWLPVIAPEACDLAKVNTGRECAIREHGNTK